MRLSLNRIIRPPRVRLSGRAGGMSAPLFPGRRRQAWLWGNVGGFRVSHPVPRRTRRH